MMNILKITILLFALAATPMTAKANDMIDSSAKGYVSGNVTQIAEGSSTNEIFVGSIVNQSGRSIRNIHVQAYVNGDIFVKTNNSNARVSIGSYVQKRR